MTDEQKSSPVQGAAIKGSQDPLIGTTLDGRFYIEGVLGSGGTSIVYKAKQLRINRDVAIKTLQLQLESVPNLKERFEREMTSLCAMNHPNIVTVHDCIVGPDARPYIVMDYLKGRSLQALIEDEGWLPLERFAHIAVQISNALDYAHKKGIVHRDLKPGNIVLLEEEMDFVKVVDFGLAHLDQASKRLTNTGELLGSPPYMSPEQCTGGAIDERSDIYSLGCVMYEMLSGEEPFGDAITIFEVIAKHLHAQPKAIIQVNPRVVVPSAVEDVIFKALEKEPAKRFQSAAELQSALVAACAGHTAKQAHGYLQNIALPAGRSAAPDESDREFEQPSAPVPVSDYFARALNPMGDEPILAPTGESDSRRDPHVASIAHGPSDSNSSTSSPSQLAQPLPGGHESAPDQIPGVSAAPVAAVAPESSKAVSASPPQPLYEQQPVHGTLAAVPKEKAPLAEFGLWGLAVLIAAGLLTWGIVAFYPSGTNVNKALLNGKPETNKQNSSLEPLPNLPQLAGPQRMPSPASKSTPYQGPGEQRPKSTAGNGAGDTAIKSVAPRSESLTGSSPDQPSKPVSASRTSQGGINPGSVQHRPRQHSSKVSHYQKQTAPRSNPLQAGKDPWSELNQFRVKPTGTGQQ